MKQMKKFWLLTLVVAVAIVGAACSQEAPAGETPQEEAAETADAVATVNGEPITQERFDKQLEQFRAMYEQQGIDLDAEENAEMLTQIENSALNQLVQEEVLLQAAEEAGVDVSSEEISTEIEAMKAQFGTEEEFNGILEDIGMTLEDLDRMVDVQLTIDRYLAEAVEAIEVTDEEVQTSYDEYVAYMDAQEVPEGEEPQEIPTFEEVKEALRDQIASQRQETAIGEHIGSLMEESTIETQQEEATEGEQTEE